ncbi:MAG: hypothetical protein NTV72_02815 [Candidatus Taylorbacteria bacterium]|nr:hypothetical protein [Candidatus Taylorbacteria bacterium]
MNNKGYTLLYAILLSSLILVVGVSILVIGKKEIQLAAQTRASQQAIYASDTGIECFERKVMNGGFSTSSSFSIVAGDESLKCNGSIPYVWDSTAKKMVLIISEPTWVRGGSDIWSLDMINVGSPAREYLYFMGEPVGGGVPIDPKMPCFSAQVVRHIPDNGSIATTTITVNGYNTCDVYDNGRVQRTLELKF